MSKEAVHYLLFNKKNYSREVLVQALRQAGYEENDISASVATVFGDGHGSEHQQGTSIDEVSGYKIYNTREEKVKDYIIGIVISIPCLIVPILGWITGIAMAVHYYNRKRYRFYGLVTFIAIAVLFIIINFSEDFIYEIRRFIF